MIEGLVILRDVILAVLLSWIGVDYQDNAQEPREARQTGVALAANTVDPMVLISERHTYDQPFDCASTRQMTT